MLTCDEYVMPEALGEALALWRDAPAGSRLVAGATDILPWAREGRAGDVHVPMIVDLSRVAELAGYEIKAGRVRLGANVVYQDFLRDDALARAMPAMPFCAVWFADDQIRETATLAGNLVNASPAADGTPPVVATNGVLEMTHLEDGAIVRRHLPVEDFITGPGRTALGPDEIVTAVYCDALHGYGGSFEKVGQRRSLVISVACATALVKVSADGGTFEDVRFSVGGVTPVPLRLSNVERFLKGGPVSAERIAEAARMTDGVVQSRTRREYRSAVVRGFMERALINALRDAGHDVAAPAAREIAHA